MANEEDGLPDLFIAQGSLGGGHSGGKDAVVDDPLKLTVGITLHLGRSEGRNWRRDTGGERDARVLAVAPVAHDAIVAEDMLAGIDVLGSGRERVFHLLAADGDVVLDPIDGGLLGFPWRVGAAAGKGRQREGRGDTATE